MKDVCFYFVLNVLTKMTKNDARNNLISRDLDQWCQSHHLLNAFADRVMSLHNFRDSAALLV